MYTQTKIQLVVQLRTALTKLASALTDVAAIRDQINSLGLSTSLVDTDLSTGNAEQPAATEGIKAQEVFDALNSFKTVNDFIVAVPTTVPTGTVGDGSHASNFYKLVINN